MKKALSLMLALLMCLSLCACGVNPLEKECASIDEVVTVLAENYDNTEEDRKLIKANPTIYQYFRKDYFEEEIWKKLNGVKDESGNAVFSLSEIHSLYNICNQLGEINAEPGADVPMGDLFDTWFEYINVHGEPFIMYGDSGMTVKKLTESIKKKFKDPDSVSIENAWICYALPEGAESEESITLYDEDCRYVILAEVRAKNGFGAYGVSVCRIEGSIGWGSWTFGVEETSSSASLLTRPYNKVSGYSEWYRLF